MEPQRAVRRPRPSAPTSRTGEDPAVEGGKRATTAVVNGVAPVTARMPTTITALQHTAGNQAVGRLITAQRDATVTATPVGAEPAAPDPYGLLDDPDFNASTITNDLLRAIDQSQHNIVIEGAHPVGARGTPQTGHEVAGEETRKIDVAAVVKALDHRTPRQLAEVRRRYEAYERRSLDTDLFGRGASGRLADLTVDQRMRIESLLRGTKADPVPSDLESELRKYPAELAVSLRAAVEKKANAVAAANQLEADTIEVHDLFQDKLDDASRERIMLLFRRELVEIEAMEKFYDKNYGNARLVYDSAYRLTGLQKIRFEQLRLGHLAQADAVAIEDKRRQIEALNKADAAFTGGSLGALGAQTDVGKAYLKGNEDTRRRLTADIEKVIEQNRREAVEAAPGKESGGAVVERLQKILGQQDGGPGETVRSQLEHTLGKEHMGAIAAESDPWASAGSEGLVTAAAYRLAAMEKDHTTTATEIIATLRSFPAMAEHDLLAHVRDRAIPLAEKQAIGSDIEGAVTKLAHRYVDEYKVTYDRIRGEGRAYDEIVDSATHDADKQLMQNLYYGGGRTSDVAELQHAMGMREVDAVKAILRRQKSGDAVRELVAAYNKLGDGRDLMAELFGHNVTGAVDVTWAEKAEKRRQTGGGLMTDRDAAQTFELLARPTKSANEGPDMAEAADGRQRNQADVEWMALGGENELTVTMLHRGRIGHIREWGGDPETEAILKHTNEELKKLVERWSNATDPAEKRHLLMEIQKTRATLTGDADAYEKDNARVLGEIQSALTFAVSIALAVALPGAGAGLAAFFEATAIQIAANVAANVVIKGDDYGWADLEGDIIGGALGAGGAKIGEKLLGNVALKIAGTTAKAAVGAAEKAGIEAATLTGQVAGLARRGEKVAVDAAELEAKLAGREVGDALGVDAAAAGKAMPGAVLETAVRTTTTGKVLEELGGFWGGIYGGHAAQGDFTMSNLSIDEVLQALAGLAAGKLAHGHKAGGGHPGDEERTGSRRQDEEPGARREEEPTERDTTTEPTEHEGGAGGGGPAKPRVEPPAPGGRTTADIMQDRGIPSENADALQRFADDHDLVVKVRPTNVASLPVLQHGGGVPKPEIVKVKTLNKYDQVIGGPAQPGKVGFFEPKRPPRELLEAMSADTRRIVEERFNEREVEYRDLKDDYALLAKEGIIRVQDGVLQVADPRRPTAPDAPHGGFRDVGGDLDVFDITHSDGSPLTDGQRAYATAYLRSIGVNVEHGFHTAWPMDSPGTLDKAAYDKIVARHTDTEPLVAFVPKSAPREVFANEVVTGPPRVAGKNDRHRPLKGATVTDPHAKPPPGAPGAGPDIDRGENDWHDVMPGAAPRERLPVDKRFDTSEVPAPGTPRSERRPGARGADDVHGKFDVSDAGSDRAHKEKRPAPSTAEADADLGDVVEPPKRASAGGPAPATTPAAAEIATAGTHAANARDSANAARTAAAEARSLSRARRARLAAEAKAAGSKKRPPTPNTEGWRAANRAERHAEAAAAAERAAQRAAEHAVAAARRGDVVAAEHELAQAERHAADARESARQATREALLVAIDGVNPGQGEHNCALVAAAVDARFANDPEVYADPRHRPDMLMDIEKKLGAGAWQNTSEERIKTQMAVRGEGARGVVSVDYLMPDGRVHDEGHVFNVIVKNGEVFFVDGQSGKVESSIEALYPHDTLVNMQYLQTGFAAP